MQLFAGNALHIDALYKTAPLYNLPGNPYGKCANSYDEKSGAQPEGIAGCNFDLIAEEVSGKKIGADPYQHTKTVEQQKSAETGAGSTRQRRGYDIESRNKFREKERTQAVSDEEIFSPAYARVRLDRHFALQFICKMSIEPDSCVRRTENPIVRYGPGWLLLSKLISGFH